MAMEYYSNTRAHCGNGSMNHSHNGEAMTHEGFTPQMCLECRTLIKQCFYTHEKEMDRIDYDYVICLLNVPLFLDSRDLEILLGTDIFENKKMKYLVQKFKNMIDNIPVNLQTRSRIIEYFETKKKDVPDILLSPGFTKRSIDNLDTEQQKHVKEHLDRIISDVNDLINMDYSHISDILTQMNIFLDTFNYVFQVKAYVIDYDIIADVDISVDDFHNSIHEAFVIDYDRNAVDTSVNDYHNSSILFQRVMVDRNIDNYHGIIPDCQCEKCTKSYNDTEMKEREDLVTRIVERLRSGDFMKRNARNRKRSIIDERTRWYAYQSYDKRELKQTLMNRKVYRYPERYLIGCEIIQEREGEIDYDIVKRVFLNDTTEEKLIGITKNNMLKVFLPSITYKRMIESKEDDWARCHLEESRLINKYIE